MLMAAALLISTNMWAATLLVNEASDLQTQINAAQNGDVVKLMGNFNVGNQIVLNADKHIILDLNGTDMVINNTSGVKNVGILIQQGILEIVTTNGEASIANGSDGTNYTVDLIRVYGTSEDKDARIETPYSQVIVGDKVTLENTKTGSGKKFNVITIFQNADKLANGARVDVLSGALLSATTYGIKVNGDVIKPTDANNSPYVYIHKGATVSTNETGSGSVAAYSSGYARWLIEGTCTGSTGLYVHSGQVQIAGTIESTNDSPTHTTKTGANSGVNTGGSAIVVESNDAYPGAIEVVITEGSEISGKNGYAIEETIEEGYTSEVQMITIQGGDIQGGAAGAIIITDQTADDNVTVVGGDITGNIQIANGATIVNNTDAGNGMSQFLPGGTNAESAYIVTVDQDDVTGKYSYSVVPDKSKSVVMNAFGWSTFSANAARKLPTGVTAYIAKYVSGDAITLSPLANDIPANTGVILSGKAGNAYTLFGNDAVPSTIEDVNQLVAASEWGGSLANDIYTADAAKDNVYVLSGNELLKYTGKQMKVNKAYLQLPAAGPYGAPKRVKLVVAETEETQAVDNVETTIEAVKFMENGQIYIRRGENIYNVQGQIVK